MLRIGITGGIGNGKSTAAKAFSVLGIPVFDADAVAKNIMNEDEVLKNKIIEAFGKEAYENEKLNKKYIASIVFNDEKKLQQLNALVHPAAIAAAEKWMQTQTAPYALKEAALIFESNAAAGLDYIIGVFAPMELRIKRLAMRDHLSKNEIEKRMSNQIDEGIKMRLCDFVIINDEERLMMPQILKIHEQLLKLSTKT